MRHLIYLSRQTKRSNSESTFVSLTAEAMSTLLIAIQNESMKETDISSSKLSVLLF